MKLIALLLQIGDLFKGNFTWRGFAQLAIFVVMGLIVVGVGGVIVYKVIQSARNKKDGF